MHRCFASLSMTLVENLVLEWELSSHVPLPQCHPEEGVSPTRDLCIRFAYSDLYGL